MTQEQIKLVLKRMCIDVFGKKAVVAWDIDTMAEQLERYAGQYKVEVRLALAQGILESHFCVNPAASRSRTTHNIFNVGNVDDGGNRYFGDWQGGMAAYFKLMAREYCYRNEGNTVTAEMMVAHDFIRPRGGRYATAPSYTQDIAKIVEKIDKLIGG
jgi:flagellum-specific peptidoglycan hydrolase FlgJ